jgi:hypothetical protein
MARICKRATQNRQKCRAKPTDGSGHTCRGFGGLEIDGVASDVEALIERGPEDLLLSLLRVSIRALERVGKISALTRRTRGERVRKTEARQRRAPSPRGAPV